MNESPSAGSSGRRNNRINRVIRILVFTALALAVGFVGASLFFADGASTVERFVMAAVLYLVFGILTGIFNPTVWVLALVSAWGPLVLGIVGILNVLADPTRYSLEEQATVLGIVVVPLGVAMLGGYLGRVLRTRFRS